LNHYHLILLKVIAVSCLPSRKPTDALNQKAVVVEEASLTLALPIKWEMQEYANVENGSQRHR